MTARASAYNERVLRYPDGRERRIRYPALAPTSSAVLEEQQEDELDYRFSTCEELGECWETCEAYRLAGQATAHAGTAERAAAPATPHREQVHRAVVAHAAAVASGSPSPHGAAAQLRSMRRDPRARTPIPPAHPSSPSCPSPRWSCCAG